MLIATAQFNCARFQSSLEVRILRSTSTVYVVLGALRTWMRTVGELLTLRPNLSNGGIPIVETELFQAEMDLTLIVRTRFAPLLFVWIDEFCFVATSVPSPPRKSVEMQLRNPRLSSMSLRCLLVPDREAWNKTHARCCLRARESDSLLPLFRCPTSPTSVGERASHIL